MVLRGCRHQPLSAVLACCYNAWGLLGERRGIEAMADINKVSQDDLIAGGVRVWKSARQADALLISCGGFRTLEIIAPLEKQIGAPVISSMPHGLWAGARLVGLSGRAPGYGQLLSR